MIFLILLLLATVAFPKQLQIVYIHTTKSILLYQQNGEPLALGLTFQHKDISLHQSLKDKPLFFNKQARNSLQNLTKHAKFDYKIKMALKQRKNDDIMGSVGLGEGSRFYQLLKQIINTNSIKIQVKHKQGLLRVVPESCNYPIFLPLMLTLSQTNTHSYSVQKFSTNFRPDSQFLKVINKSKSPFSMSKEQKQQELTVSLRDRVISVPLTSLIECGKYSNSESFECQVQQFKEPELGGLIFDFDPVFCGNAIEFDSEPVSVWGYHYSHIILLVLQFCLLGCLLRAQRVKNLMNRALNLKFS